MGTWRHSDEINPVTLLNCFGTIVNKKFYSAYEKNTVCFDIEDETWEVSEDWSEYINWVGCTSLGKNVHFLGGYITSSSPSRVKNHIVYDTETKTYSKASDLPIGMSEVKSVVYKDKIYAVWGHMATGTPYISKNVFVYDPQSNTWETKTPSNTSILPDDSFGSGYALVDDKIYILGGRTSPSSMYVYDILHNSWSLAGQMPETRIYINCAVVGKKIYGIAGKSAIGNNTPPSTMLIYDTVTKTWTTDSGVNVNLGNETACASYKGKVYITGMKQYMYIYTPDDYVEPETTTITHEYVDESGTPLRPNTTNTAEISATYTGTATTISGYYCIGHRIDGGALQTGSTSTIYDVQSDHTITFVYRKDEGGGEEPRKEVHGCFKVKMQIESCSNNSLFKEVCGLFERSDCDCECDCCCICK